MKEETTAARRKVLMVVDGFFPPDIRIRKEVDALVEGGLSVVLACYREEGQPITEQSGSLEILRTSEVISPRKKGFIDIFNSIFNFNPAIRKLLNSTQITFEAVHAHDLPVANTVLQYAKKHNLISVIDFHENYPEATEIWFSWRKSPWIRIKNRIFFPFKKWKSRENRMVHGFDKVIAVVEEMKEKLIFDHRVDAAKIQVITNSERSTLFGQSITVSEPEGNKVVYVGGIGPHRGLDTAIEAMANLKDSGADFILEIIGSGHPDNIAHLKNLTRKFGVEDKVVFTGQLPFDEAINRMRGAFLNIIPHLSNGHTDNTIPHKLFQIMNSGFPLMVSSSAPLKRVVESYQAGVVFEAGSARSFSEKVLWAEKNRDLLKEYAENALHAVRHIDMNWEAESRKLVEMYLQLLD